MITLLFYSFDVDVTAAPLNFGKFITQDTLTLLLNKSFNQNDFEKEKEKKK